VELASFHAQLDQKGVYLSWVTLNEFQNLGFNVYRSLDSTGPFEKINPKTIAGKGTTTEQQSYSYLDDSAPPNQTLFYMLEQIDTDGSVHRFDHIDISTAGMAIPDQYSLYQNYPNPFNPITTIQYDLPEKAFVRLTVYNTKGERIKTLVSYTQPPGSHKISWDGSTDTGNRAPSGLYFYKLECQNHTDVKKMILTR
jgi:hypothetical protein